MDISVLHKRIALGPLAVLAVGLALVGSLVFTDTSSATKYMVLGQDCQSTDGKISGRGATYQNGAETELANAYSEYFCGSVAEQFPGDPAGSDMVIWNYPSAESNNLTSSSKGLLAASCRTDAYAGSSSPYTQVQLEKLDGTPGLLATYESTNCKLSPATAPYQPVKESTYEYPNSSDVQAKIMTIPIGGSAVALLVNLAETGTCTAGHVPSSLAFTPEEVSRIYGGDALTWNDAELVANNPGLSYCSGAITRVERKESAASTTILKSYMEKVDSERTGSACGSGKKWSEYTKEKWPETGTCSSHVLTTASGNAPEVTLTDGTTGGVGYADLAAAREGTAIIANVQNATDTGDVAPGGTEGPPNCNFNLLSLPGSDNEDAVGLNTTDDWATNQGPGGANPTKLNHENATDLGSQYPICGLAFDLVYSGLSEPSSEGHSAITPLTNDQRRTLYSYFTFVLSSVGQERLPNAGYDELPSTWLIKLQDGFQENF
jgi:ABC-type phosphate transport system substrate-binding protein